MEVDPTFALHETVEIYRHADQQWYLADVIEVLPDGGVRARYKDRDGEKTLPREFLEPKFIRKAMAKALVENPVDDATTIYVVGDPVEVCSQPDETWHKGIVSSVSDSTVTVTFQERDCVLKNLNPLRDDSRLLRFCQTVQPGSRVQLHGLSGDDADFNGKRGVAKRFVDGTWFVKLKDEKELDMHNVRAADGSGHLVQSGSWVQLCQLSGADAKFNGKVGWATTCGRGKCSVQLEKDVNATNVKVFDGKLAIFIKCSERTQGWKLEEAWKVKDILVSVARECDIHESCVELTYRGRRFDMHPEIGVGKIFIKKKGLDAGMVYATIVREVFPEQLGPFQPVPVEIEGRSFGFTRLENIDTEGTFVELHRNAATQLGLPTSEPIVTQTSPRYPVTLGIEEKRGANIPVDATHFLWCYQMPTWSSPMNANDDIADTFLKLGGYMYLNANQEVLQVTTLLPPQDATCGGLQFESPKRWDHTWTQSLNRAGRFQRVVMPFLNEVGVTGYCWLGPNEKILDENGTPYPSQPQTSHGAFVYLFHNDQHDKANGNKLDRYFAVVSGEGYKRRREGVDPDKIKACNPLGLLDPNLTKAVSNASLQSGDVQRPEHWTADSGLVRLDNIHEFQALFDALPDGTHKTSDNWTRDRGCRLCGPVTLECSQRGHCYRNKAPVPIGYTVLEVFRNQNMELWEQYSRQLSVVSAALQKLGAEMLNVPIHTTRFHSLAGSTVQPPDSLWLFHGTGAAACKGICDTNFQSDNCGCGDTWKPLPGADWGRPLYGYGYYLAENVTKSDEYAKDLDDEGNHTGIFSMLLCRVALGRPLIVVDNEIGVDHESQVASGNRNCVIGDRVSRLRKPYREVVLYESEQIYPEFIIKYQRRYEHR